jgi:hypothetical protein
MIEEVDQADEVVVELVDLMPVSIATKKAIVLLIALNQIDALQEPAIIAEPRDIFLLNALNLNVLER